jgi:hypothetical protein
MIVSNTGLANYADLYFINSPQKLKNCTFPVEIKISFPSPSP